VDRASGHVDSRCAGIRGLEVTCGAGRGGEIDAYCIGGQAQADCRRPKPPGHQARPWRRGRRRQRTGILRWQVKGKEPGGAVGITAPTLAVCARSLPAQCPVAGPSPGSAGRAARQELVREAAGGWPGEALERRRGGGEDARADGNHGCSGALRNAQKLAWQVRRLTRPTPEPACTSCAPGIHLRTWRPVSDDRCRRLRRRHQPGRARVTATECVQGVRQQ
jgi:hypothetical protein